MSEIVRIEVSMADFIEIREMGIDYDLIRIEEVDFDYSKDEQWQKLKSASSKKYKELKKLEFNLRQKK